MDKKKTLRKVTIATGVVVMSVGLFNSFDLEAQTTGGGSTNGYEEVEKICPNGTETHRCDWNDAASCDVSGQEPC